MNVCSDCAHWRSARKDALMDDVTITAPPGDDGPDGICRRFPARVRTLALDGCAEWLERTVAAVDHDDGGRLYGFRAVPSHVEEGGQAGLLRVVFDGSLGDTIWLDVDDADVGTLASLLGLVRRP